jgi:hypothetical protein
MDLLLDSTVFWDDPNLKSEAWALLREYIRRSGARVLIPAIVRDEVEAKFAERLKKDQDRIDSAFGSIARLTEAAVKLPEIDSAIQSERYNLRLDSRLSTLNARALPYPPTTHEAIVERQLKGLRPFHQKGTGYRDALIWYSLLEELKKESRDCVVITNNTVDFSLDKDDFETPHGDFQTDLDSSGIKAKVEIRRSLDEFIDDFVKPTLTKLEDFKLQLQSGKPVDLKLYLEDRFSQVFEGLRHAPLRIVVPNARRLEEPIGVSSMNEEPSHIDIDDVLELNDHEIYLEFRAVYNADIFGFLFRTDAFGLGDGSDIYVTDIDRNNHYAEVGVNLELEVRFGAIYDRDEKEFVTLEVKEAKTNIAG